MRRSRAQSELIATMVLATIVLGAIAWLVVQWERNVGMAVKRMEEIASRSSKLGIRIDCTGNYLVFVDPTVPSVIDPALTAYSNLRYCYAELTLNAYKAYIVLPFYCNGQPGAYIIYGNFTKVVENNVVLYTFHPLTSSAIVPAVVCNNINFMPFAQLHIIFPDMSEKVASCMTNVTYVNGAYVWGVTSCVGA